jgi:outer membrane lipopolysaccharide assembly protein LptE/RlpB
MRSRSRKYSAKTNRQTDIMKTPVPAVLVLALALATGCSLFHSRDKKAAPPELPPAAGIEAEFRDRWMNKRVHDLLASGAAKTDDEAKQMAANEFAKLYPYVNSGYSATSR